MSFIMPDLVIEATIRDGLADLAKNPEKVNNIFESLLAPYNKRKYGTQELERLRKMVSEKEIAVVHSFNEIATRVPCFSIQLGADTEDKRLARLGDFESDTIEDLTEQEDLDNLIVLDELIGQNYDPNSGQISVLDSVDLSGIYKGLILVDGSGEEFTIKDGTSNVNGNKFFTIEKNLNPDLNDFLTIKSSLDFKQFEVNSVTSNVNILIGIHSKNALTTKYMYVLLKYFMLSRKPDLIKRCFIASSFSGSDFTRNMEYQGDMVFTRFMTITGKIEDSWNGEDVELIDNIDVGVLVPKDVASAEDIGVEDQTVKPSDRDDFK